MIRAFIPTPNHCKYTMKISYFLSLSGTPKGGKNPEKDEARGEGDGSSLILFNTILVLLLDTCESNHLIRGHYGPTQGNFHPIATAPFMR